MGSELNRALFTVYLVLFSIFLVFGLLSSVYLLGDAQVYGLSSTHILGFLLISSYVGFPALGAYITKKKPNWSTMRTAVPLGLTMALLLICVMFWLQGQSCSALGVVCDGGTSAVSDLFGCHRCPLRHYCNSDSDCKDGITCCEISSCYSDTTIKYCCDPLNFVNTAICRSTSCRNDTVCKQCSTGCFNGGHCVGVTPMGSQVIPGHCEPG